MTQQQQYIHGHHASVLRSHSWRTVENSCAYLIPYLNSPTLKILDIGCGPGTITVDLASRVPEGSVIGIDTAEDVIEKAKNHAADKGIRNVKFSEGSVYNLELAGLEEGSFDIVHAHQVLQHLPDPVGALKEMKKFVKPGGIIAVRDVDYEGCIYYPDIPDLDLWKNLYVRVAKGLGGDPNIGRRLHALAMEAGFERKYIDASVATWCFSTPEEREWWCGLWADRSVQSAFKGNALGQGATEEDLLRIVKAWRTLEKREDGWLSMIHGQIICHVT